MICFFFVGINCRCRLCETHRHPDFKIKEQSFNPLLNEFRELNSQSCNDPKKLQKALDLVSQFEQVCPFPPDLNLHLLDCLMPGGLCDALFTMKRYNDGIDLAKKLYPITESVNEEGLLMEVATQLVISYFKLGNKKETQEWFEKLKQLSLVRFGWERALESWHDAVILRLRMAGVNVEKMMRPQKKNKN